MLSGNDRKYRMENKSIKLKADQRLGGSAFNCKGSTIKFGAAFEELVKGTTMDQTRTTMPVINQRLEGVRQRGLYNNSS